MSNPYTTRDNDPSLKEWIVILLVLVFVFGLGWLGYIKVSDWIFDWRMGTCQEKGYSQEACAMRLRSN